DSDSHAPLVQLSVQLSRKNAGETGHDGRSCRGHERLYSQHSKGEAERSPWPLGLSTAGSPLGRVPALASQAEAQHHSAFMTDPIPLHVLVPALQAVTGWRPSIRDLVDTLPRVRR